MASRKICVLKDCHDITKQHFLSWCLIHLNDTHESPKDLKFHLCQVVVQHKAAVLSKRCYHSHGVIAHLKKYDMIAADSICIQKPLIQPFHVPETCGNKIYQFQPTASQKCCSLHITFTEFSHKFKWYSWITKRAKEFHLWQDFPKWSSCSVQKIL